MSLPQEQITDAHLLQNDGLVYLYTITPAGGGTVAVKANNTVMWQGTTYTGTAVQLSTLNQSSDGELSRPTLTFANPLGVYSALVGQGTLDNAVVTQQTVLLQHILSNSNICVQRRWKVRRPTEVSHLRIVLELRDYLDGQQFLLPGRMYTPPEFPSVTL